MPLHHHVGTAADEKATRGLNALLAQKLNLLDQVKRIQDDPVPDDTLLARMQNARRDEVQHILFATRDHRVACVTTALKPHYHIRLRGQDIDNLTFALITPLRTHQNRIRHK